MITPFSTATAWNGRIAYLLCVISQTPQSADRSDPSDVITCCN